MRMLPNGDIVANDIPERLKTRYKQNPSDPRHWQLQWPICIHHEEKKGKCPKSGRITLLPWCVHFDKLISPVVCDGCPARQE